MNVVIFISIKKFEFDYLCRKSDYTNCIYYVKYSIYCLCIVCVNKLYTYSICIWYVSYKKYNIQYVKQKISKNGLNQGWDRMPIFNQN